jgi:hypothetical protein
MSLLPAWICDNFGMTILTTLITYVVRYTVQVKQPIQLICISYLLCTPINNHLTHLHVSFMCPLPPAGGVQRRVQHERGIVEGDHGTVAMQFDVRR